MVPKCNSSDAGSASKPKRIRDVLSIFEKVKNLDIVEIKKKCYAEIAKLYGNNETHDFCCLCSALMEKHNFYFSVIP